MATYQVPDLLNIKGIWVVSLATFGVPFSYLQIVPHTHDHMIQQAYEYVSLSLWPCLTFFELKIKWVGTRKEWVSMGTKCFIAVGVFSVELLTYQVSMFCAGNWPRYLYFRLALDLFIYLVECMTSSVISFAYFTHFSNLNSSETNAGICKR